MAVKTFDGKKILGSYDQLKKFLAAENAIKRISETPKNSYVPIPHSPNLALRWHVLNVITWYPRVITSFFLQTIAFFVSFVSMRMAEPLYHLQQRIDIGFDYNSTDATKVFLLQQTENHPSPKAKVLLANHPQIPFTEITDHRVKKLLNETKSPTHVVFNHKNGICRGESWLFVYFFLKTKHLFADPRDHVAAIAKRFRNGGPKEATLLQSLWIHDGNVLNMYFGKISLVSFKDLKTKKNALNYLAPGPYLLGAPKHQMAFIKISNTFSLFFDPNQGVLVIEGPDQAEKLQRLVKEYFYKKEDKSLDFQAVYRG